jgi:hypothetical protein
MTIRVFYLRNVVSGSRDLFGYAVTPTGEVLASTVCSTVAKVKSDLGVVGKQNHDRYAARALNFTLKWLANGEDSDPDDFSELAEIAKRVSGRGADADHRWPEPRRES